MSQKENGVFPYEYVLDIFSGGLFNAPMFAAGESVQIEYVFDCPEFHKLREQYPVERVAGKGGDYERALRLGRPHRLSYEGHRRAL